VININIGCIETEAECLKKMQIQHDKH